MAQNYEIVYPIYQSDIDGISVCDKSVIKANVPLMFNEKSRYYTGGEINFSLECSTGVLKTLIFKLPEKSTKELKFKVTGYRFLQSVSREYTLPKDKDTLEGNDFWGTITSIIPLDDYDKTINISGDYSNCLLGCLRLNNTISNVTVFLSVSEIIEKETSAVCIFSNSINFFENYTDFAVLPNDAGKVVAPTDDDASELVYFQTNMPWMLFDLKTEIENPMKIIINVNITN